MGKNLFENVKCLTHTQKVKNITQIWELKKFVPKNPPRNKNLIFVFFCVFFSLTYFALGMSLRTTSGFSLNFSKRSEKESKRQ